MWLLSALGAPVSRGGDCFVMKSRDAIPISEPADGDRILPAVAWCVERLAIRAFPRDMPGRSRLSEFIIPGGNAGGKARARGRNLSPDFPLA